MITILLRRCQIGWLAMWWEPDRSAPYDCKWGFTRGEAVDRLDLEPDPATATVVEMRRTAA
jgi:hypothetical protein